MCVRTNTWTMHLSSEVTSTTNGLGHEAPSSSYNSGLPSQPLTAELLAERTLEGLLADHPGELVKTGCPHVVSILSTYIGNFIPKNIQPQKKKR